MSRARRTNGPVIDLHCHRDCAPAADFMKEAQLASGKVALGQGNATTRRANELQLATIKPKMDILDLRIADMDKMGVDVQVRRPVPASSRNKPSTEARSHQSRTSRPRSGSSSTAGTTAVNHSSGPRHPNRFSTKPTVQRTQPQGTS